MTNTPGASSPLGRYLGATGQARSTGRLDIAGGMASIWFFLGRPVHASAAVDGEILTGERALGVIVSEHRRAERVEFTAGEVPAYTLECTVDDLVNRVDGDAVTENPPPSDEKPRRAGLGEVGHVPLLPRGRPLFDGIPLGAIVLEALAPALANGAIIVNSKAGAQGVVLVRDGRISENYCFDGGRRLLGASAMNRIRSLGDAGVSAYQFSAEMVDLAPVLLRGDSLYEDLRLKWIDWASLLRDLGERPGTYVVELETGKGSGVTCLRDGKHIGTYTDKHPELGEPSLLDPLVGADEGTIWVRRTGRPLAELEAEASAQSAPVAQQSAPVQPQVAVQAAPADSRPAPQPQVDVHTAPSNAGRGDRTPFEPTAAPFPGGAGGRNGQPSFPGEPGGAPPLFDVPAGVPGAPQAQVGPSRSPRSPLESTFADILSSPAGDGRDGGNGAHSGGDLNALLPELKAIARARLQRQATRLETILDEAAAQGRPVDEVLSEIRGLTIRGVMQSTLGQVVDEMESTASRA